MTAATRPAPRKPHLAPAKPRRAAHAPSASRRATHKPATDADARAESRAKLVARLCAIRARIVASGEKLLTMDEILAEIERNRGGSPWRPV